MPIQYSVALRNLMLEVPLMSDDTGTITLTLGPIPDHTPIPDENDYYEVTVIRSRSHWEVKKVRVLAVSCDDAFSEVENQISETDFWYGADQSEGDFDGWEFDDCRKLKVSEANE